MSSELLQCVQIMAAARLAKPILWLQHLVGARVDPAAAVGHSAHHVLLRNMVRCKRSRRARLLSSAARSQLRSQKPGPVG